MSVYTIEDSKDFNTFFAKNAKHDYVLCDFMAHWCGPCIKIAPHLENFAKKYLNVKFIKVDVDVHRFLVEKYHIESMPTFILFKSSATSPIAILNGASVSKLQEMLENRDNF